MSENARSDEMHRRIDRFTELIERYLDDDWLDAKERRELSDLSSYLVAAALNGDEPEPSE